MTRLPIYAVTLSLLGSCCAAASITDLTQWDLIEDPPSPNLSSFVDGPDSVLLNADDAVPSGTDIGFASVDGPDVAGATTGHFFDPASDFEVAIDFDVLTRSTTGGAGIGLGIGEDRDGTDSAGIGLALLNGAPTAYSTAGRTNDVDEPLQLFATAPDTAVSAGGALNEVDGRLFVRYDAATLDVTVGFSATPGAAAPDETRTLSGVAGGWDGDPLLVSFFLRSQSVLVFPGIDSGSIRTTFGPLEVLQGVPIQVPEPGAAVLALAACWAPVRRLGDAR